MDMVQLIKTIISIAREFENHKDLDSVIQHLQILSASDDLSVFDTTSFETAEFFTILYDLLTQNSSNTELVWCIINVLLVAVRNPNASSTLVQSYHFIIPLTTILESQVISEKKLVVLKLLQELTYGVVICYQEAYLQKLIRILLDIIMSNECELIPVALGVMVNLCHKNKPAIYTLMNCVDMKTFLRTILNLQRDNVSTSVQVCKLLMILNQLSGGNVPDTEILSFVRVSFLRINKAFRCGNTILMRHIVDFFRDAKESEQDRKILLTYPKYQEETDNLINELCKKEVPNSWQCVHQLLEFMQQLIDLEQLTILPLFPRLARSVLPWIQVGGVARTGLCLLTTMLCQSRSKDIDIYNALNVAINDHMPMFIEMLHNGCRAKPTSSEEQESLTSLFHLFNELTANASLSADIASTVDKEELKNLLLPLTLPRSDSGSQLFQQSVATLYVEVLSFVSKLSMNDKEWLFLYLDLLQKKQIIEALAVALYFGSYEVKKQILYLAGTSSFSKESLNVLSKCLSDINQLFPFTTNPTHNNPEKCVTYSQLQLDCTNYFTKTHKEHLDRLIEKLDDLYKKNQIHDSSLSGIIELYNYKLGEMRRAERSLQCSLEAADAHRAHLAHRVTQLNGETGRMHQLLYAGQQSLEGAQTEVAQLREQLQTAQQAATDSHIKFRQLKQDVQSKSMIITNQTEEIQNMKQSIEELKNNCEKMDERSKQMEETNAALNDKISEQSRLIETMKQTNECLTIKNDEQSKLIQNLEQNILDLEGNINEVNRISQNLEKDKSDLSKANSKLEEKIKQRDKLILEKEVSIENKTSQVQRLEQEIANQQGLIKGLEKNLKEKERELAAQQSQLLELEKMRKVIFDITGGKKNNF